MSDDSERRRPRNLVWLPNTSGALTTLCRGAVLTIEQRGGTQWLWTVTVGGRSVGEGVSPTAENARDAAIDTAVTVAGAAAAGSKPE